MDGLLGYFSDPNPLRARVRVLEVPAPAAGSEWTANPAAGRAWRLLCGLVTLATSAVVANRFPGVTISWGGQEVFRYVGNTSLAASLTDRVSYAAGSPSGQLGNGDPAQWVTIPGFWLPPDAMLGSFTANLDVADQYGKAELLIQEAWPSPHETREHELRVEAIARELGVTIPATHIR